MDYKSVIEDFNSGVLNKSKVTLVMDNDYGYWKANTGDEAEDAKLELSLGGKYGNPRGYRDIVQVLNAAGVNCEWD